MSVSIRNLMLGLAAVLASSASASASIVVDGNLVDWGIQVASGASDDAGPVNSTGNAKLTKKQGPNFGGTNYAGLTSTPGLACYRVEDTNDCRNDYYVGKAKGGQNYDAEFLGVVANADGIYIALLSGQRPDNGVKHFAPGDIRIRTSSDRTFGIEVGGNDSGGAVKTGDDGVTYTIDGKGRRSGSATSSSRVAGSLWETFNDGTDWSENGSQLLGGALLGLTDFLFTQNDNGLTGDDSDSPEHSVVELKLPVDLLGLGAGESITSVEWQPANGADKIVADKTINPPLPSAHAPEPLGLAIWIGLGACLLGPKLRRRK